MKRTYEFIRYCLVGGLAFIADFVTFILFTDFLGINYLVSNTLGFVVGLLVNYLASIYWVFLHRRYTRAMPEFTLFAIIGVGGVALGNLFMWYLVEHLHVWHVYAKYLITALVLFYNYALRKYFLFRTPAIIRE